MIFEVLAAASLTQNPVTVEVSADDVVTEKRLRGDLLVRLLEEGHVVASPGPGVAAIQVVYADTGTTLRVQRDGQSATRELPPGTAPGIRLEILHRTLELLAELAPPEAEAGDAWRVAVEARDVSGAPVPPPLTVVDALVGEDARVVAPDQAAEARLCLLADGTRWAHMRVAGHETCEEAFVLLARADAETEDDLVEAVLATVTATTPAPRDTTASVDTPVDPPATTVDPTLRTTARLPAARPGPHAWLELSGGVTFRTDTPDAHVPLRVGAAHRSGFGAAMQAAFMPSRADALRVLDTSVVVGPAWQRRVGRRIELGVAALVGALIHRSRFGDEGVRHRVDLDVAVPVVFSVRVVDRFRLGAEAGLQVSNRGRTHRLDGETIWRRQPIRLGVGLTLGYTWGGA